MKFRRCEFPALGGVAPFRQKQPRVRGLADPAVDFCDLSRRHKGTHRRADIVDASAAVAQFHQKRRRRIKMMELVERRVVGDIALLNRRQQNDRINSRIGHLGKPIRKSGRLALCRFHGRLPKRAICSQAALTQPSFFFFTAHLPVFLLTTRPSSHLPSGPGSSPSFCANDCVVISGTAAKATPAAAAPTKSLFSNPRRSWSTRARTFSRSSCGTNKPPSVLRSERVTTNEWRTDSFICLARVASFTTAGKR